MKLKVEDVAPDILLKVAPPSVLTCHCTVGVGVPLAAVLNEAVKPAHPDWTVGLVPTTGATFNVSEAAVVVAVPQ